jgi:hypothetical protein
MGWDEWIVWRWWLIWRKELNFFVEVEYDEIEYDEYDEDDVLDDEGYSCWTIWCLYTYWEASSVGLYSQLQCYNANVEGWK